jgi:hypothetical protein
MSEIAPPGSPATAMYRVYNAGEIPALAHGWRSVVALRPGRRWITLIDWTTLETTRLEVAAWEKLKPLSDAGISRRKVRAFMRRRLKYATSTQAIEEALRLLNGTTP